MTTRIRDYRLGIAENVRKARAAAGLTQVQVTMKTGLPQVTQSKIEKNGSNFTFETAYKLAYAFGVDLSDLLPDRSAEIEGEIAEERAALG